MLFTDSITYKNDWYKEKDFISISTVRVAGLYTGDGQLFYMLSGV